MYRSMTNLFLYLFDKYDHADAPVYYAFMEAQRDAHDAAYFLATSPEEIALLKDFSDRIISEVIAEEKAEEALKH